jgi:hypothetical protein
MLRATLNEVIPLQVFVPDGRNDLFGQVRVFNVSGAQIVSVALVNIAEGLYSVNWLPAVEGYFTAVYDLYFDSGHTSHTDYERDCESIEVSSDKTNLLRLLGLAHENAVLDQEMYGSNGRLVSARLRAYDTKDHADAAGLEGLRFVWSIAASYDSQNRAAGFQIDRIL